jgi:hypothetical protein
MEDDPALNLIKECIAHSVEQLTSHNREPTILLFRLITKYTNRNNVIDH